ncbi:MAG TPA: hypothetical protein VLA89_10755 [Gemmatimonadales bacterium]|nr:hypothetical protein [Gemmatimonadales bacterium]
MVKRSPTPRAVSWIKAMIVGVGTFALWLGSSHLAATVDHFGLVLAYIVLIVAVEIALVMCVKRSARVGAGRVSPES